MRHQCPTHEIKEQAALYALGVLTQLEARAFESHVRDGCEICRSEVFRFERDWAHLAAKESHAGGR